MRPTKISNALRMLSVAAAMFGLTVDSTWAASPQLPADTVYRNGYVYTVDAHARVEHALAVRDGRIIYVGSDAGLPPYIGKRTKVLDLHGRMLMPGLVDGHMHPLEGGTALIRCNLNYKPLTIAQMQAAIQTCLDESADREPDQWLVVMNWFQEAMVPAGTLTTHATLDVLKTARPILVESSFLHTGLLNSRALELMHISASTPDPLGGRIGRDANGSPSGIFEDSAFDYVMGLLPKLTPAESIKAAKAALDLLSRQGVTTFLDAAALPADLQAFADVQHVGGLTARAHFAVLITQQDGAEPKNQVAAMRALAQQYDQGAIQIEPRLTVRNAKMFLDGVITAPASTGAMLQPYFVNLGTAARPQWVPSTNRGPDVYFPAIQLAPLLIELADAGIDPHLHVDGDRAVHEALDAVQTLRHARPNLDIRPALAHDEIVDPIDFARFGRLNAIPVLSFQWEKPAPDTVDNVRDYLGPARYRFIEPAGALAAAGARIAFGSDWPVDALNEWFALKVGVTRTNAPSAQAQYPGRLSQDPGLSRRAVLRAITMNAAYELHQDHDTGSLESGKLADLIVLDRNFFDIPAEDIANIRVLQTMVGGRVVYQADTF